jgi:hypothetical protein
VVAGACCSQSDHQPGVSSARRVFGCGEYLRLWLKITTKIQSGLEYFWKAVIIKSDHV